MNTIVSIIFLVILVALAGFIAIKHFRRRPRGDSLNTAPKPELSQADLSGLPWTKGQVTAASIEVSGSGGKQDHKVYCPALVYRYTVDGNILEGQSEVTELSSFKLGEVEAFVAEHGPGTSLRVHYEPLQPEVSYLKLAAFNRT